MSTGCSLRAWAGDGSSARFSTAQKIAAALVQVRGLFLVAAATTAGSGFCFLDALQFLAGLEAHRFAGRDADFFAGARVAADAGLAGLHAEHAEAAELDALAAAQRGLEGLKDRFHRLLRFGAADVRGGHHGVDDVQLNHTGLQLIRGQMLECASRVVKDQRRTLHWVSFLQSIYL